METNNKADSKVNEKEIDNNEYNQYIHLFSDNKDKPYKLIKKLYKGNGTNMFLACFFLICQRSPAWVIPIATATIIDAATKEGQAGYSLIWKAFIIAAVFLLQNVFSTFLATNFYAKVNRHIENVLRMVLIEKLQYLSVLFHKESKSGKLQSKVIRDVENIYELLNQIFKTLFFFVLDITIIIAICLVKSPIVMLFFAVAAPISAFVLYKFKKPIKDRNRVFRNDMEEAQGAVAQMIEMIPITRAHGLQKEEIHKMNYFLGGIQKNGYKLDVLNGLFGACNWVAFQLVQLICLSFTATMAIQGKISVGEVVLYQTYFNQLVGQISTLINIYPNMCKGVESIRSIGDVLVDVNDEPNNAIVPVKELKGNIDFCDIVFTYPNGKKPVLNGLNLKIKAGESVAFVGSSGGGKSTILNLLIGFIQPQSGRILIDRINMTNLNMEEYRSHIAIVPQNSILFDGTVKANITYGMDNVSDERVWEVIKEVGLDEMVNNLPEGINTKLGEHGDKLSGGQKQRISIARAIIRNPQIIIFDEATSALDNESEKKVQKATEKMMKKCTTIIVAHRLSTIRNADHIVVIQDGKGVEEGTYDELLAKKGAFYNMQKN